MPHPTLVPVTEGVVKGVGTGADEELEPTGGDVVGAGAGAGTGAGVGAGAAGTAAVGTGVDADAGYEDGAVAGFAEPERDVCPDTEGADRLAFSAGGALQRFWMSTAILSISRFLFWWYVLHQLLIWTSLSGSRPLSLMVEIHSKGSALIP